MERPLLGALEQKIMLVLWQSDCPLKPSQVLARLEHQHAYTTVMTVLKRLTDKKLLKRKRDGKAYLYSPKRNKKLFAENRLGKLFDEVIGNFGDLAISQFVDSIKKDKKDLKILTEYLKETKNND